MSGFEGVRVLIVEDEGLVAMMIEDMLLDLGCEIVASVPRLPKAIEAASVLKIDLALLDVNVAGEVVFPVAEILRDRNIPFLFSTGYGARGLPDEFANCQVLHKPYSQAELQHKVVLALRI